MADRVVAYVCATLALVLAIIPTPTPEPIVVDRFITKQIHLSCTSQDLREHAWICATRKRMEAVK